VSASKLQAAKIVSVLEPRLGAVRELDEPRPLEQLILLMLARGGTLAKARKALKILQTDYVDWNDVRVTSPREVASKIEEPLGRASALEKAEKLFDLLTMIYHRFNRINLDFLLEGSNEALAEDVARKRTRLFAWLAERSYCWPAMLTLHAARKPEVVVDGGLPRVLSRLALVEAKATPAVIRERILAAVPEDLLITFQFVSYVLSEDFCHAKAPDCPHCPAKPLCPASAAFMKALREAEKKEAAAAKKAQGARVRVKSRR
jgi:endonuclease III